MSKVSSCCLKKIKKISFLQQKFFKCKKSNYKIKCSDFLKLMRLKRQKSKLDLKKRTLRIMKIIKCYPKKNKIPLKTKKNKATFKLKKLSTK